MVLYLLLNRHLLWQTADEALTHSAACAKKIFTSKSKISRAKFDEKVLEQQMKQVLESKGLDSDVPLENLNPGACKTFVVANRTRASGSAVLMRTYNNYPSTNAFHATILQAARATTAAPTLFLLIVINNIEYADGGVECNNPVQLVC